MSARLYKFTGDKLVFSEGLARIENRNGFGFINKSGEIVIKLRFQRTVGRETGFQSGLCAVTYRRKWGFINSEGEFVIPPIYKTVNSFREGAAAVQISDYSMSFIDTTGKRLFDSKYILLDEGFWMSSDRMNDFSEGLAYVIPEGDEEFKGGLRVSYFAT